jgi:hypothetical protein
MVVSVYHTFVDDEIPEAGNLGLNVLGGKRSAL